MNNMIWGEMVEHPWTHNYSGDLLYFLQSLAPSWAVPMWSGRTQSSVFHTKTNWFPLCPSLKRRTATPRRNVHRRGEIVFIQGSNADWSAASVAQVSDYLQGQCRGGYSRSSHKSFSSMVTLKYEYLTECVTVKFQFKVSLNIIMYFNMLLWVCNL